MPVRGKTNKHWVSHKQIVVLLQRRKPWSSTGFSNAWFHKNYMLQYLFFLSNHRIWLLKVIVLLKKLLKNREFVCFVPNFQPSWTATASCTWRPAATSQPRENATGSRWRTSWSSCPGSTSAPPSTRWRTAPPGITSEGETECCWNNFFFRNCTFRSTITAYMDGEEASSSECTIVREFLLSLCAKKVSHNGTNNTKKWQIGCNDKKRFSNSKKCQKQAGPRSN